jgi:hypothetical protein
MCDFCNCCCYGRCCVAAGDRGAEAEPDVQEEATQKQAQADQEQQQKQDGTEASSAACDIKGQRDLDCEVCGAAGEGLVHFNVRFCWVPGTAGVANHGTFVELSSAATQGLAIHQQHSGENLAVAVYTLPC